MSDSAPRLGTVPYVNAAPLLFGLEDEGVPVVARPPSQLASLLAADELDAAILPVVETLRHPEWRVFSNSCIATHGLVKSVLLFLKRSPARIRRVALDPHSRTSQMLTRLVVRGFSGRLPETWEADPRDALEDDSCDGVLAIGDLALKLRDRGLPYLDLGFEWVQQTGLPFVFATWVGTPAGLARHPELGARLDRTRVRGEAAVDELARRLAPQGVTSEAELRVYLGEAIRYRLAVPERAAMKLFLAQVRELLESAELGDPTVASGS